MAPRVEKCERFEGQSLGVLEERPSGKRVRCMLSIHLALTNALVVFQWDRTAEATAERPSCRDEFVECVGLLAGREGSCPGRAEAPSGALHCKGAAQGASSFIQLIPGEQTSAGRRQGGHEKRGLGERVRNALPSGKQLP